MARRRALEEAAVRPALDRWFLILGSLLVLGLLGGAGAFFYLRSQASKKAAAKPVVEQPKGPQAGAEIGYSGAVQARHTINVPAPVDGMMESIEVEIGSDLFESQVIGRIANTSLESVRDMAVQDLETAQARLNNLESSLIAARLEASRAAADAARASSEADRTERLAARERNLFKEGATARLKMEKAVKDFESAKKEAEALGDLARQTRERVDAVARDIEIARKAVEERTAHLEEAGAEMQAAHVHSPADGVLLGARVKAGEEVSVAMLDLFQIGVDLQEMQVTIEPEPPVLERLKPGLPALVEILDHSRDPVEGEVGAIDGDRVTIYFISPDPSVKPGMAAVVKLKLP